jgi:hypothetical protein
MKQTETQCNELNLKYKLPQTKRQLVVHGYYSKITNSQTKIPATFRRIFGILSGISKHLCNYKTISCGTLMLFCRTVVGKHCT